MSWGIVLYHPLNARKVADTMCAYNRYYSSSISHRYNTVLTGLVYAYFKACIYAQYVVSLALVARRTIDMGENRESVVAENATDRITATRRNKAYVVQ